MKTGEKYKSESKIFFDRVSGKNHGNSKKLHTYIMENISFEDKEVILDLGCGRGEFLDSISKVRRCILRGIDISPKMIDLCKERNISNSSFIIGDVENLPYDDNSFDKIICLNSFHHYSNPNKAIEELFRVLKIDGEIIIGEVYVFPILREVINLLLPLGRCGDYKMYSKRSLNSLFRRNGFINQSFNLIDPFLLLSIYTKKDY